MKAIIITVVLFVSLGCKSMGSFNKSKHPSRNDMVVRSILQSLSTIHKGFWCNLDSTSLPYSEGEIYIRKEVYNHINRDTFTQMKTLFFEINKQKTKSNLNLSDINDTNLSQVSRSYIYSTIKSNGEDSRSILSKKYPGFIGIISCSDISYSKNGEYAFLFLSWYGGGLSSSRDFYLLQKKDDKWMIVYVQNMSKS